MKKFLLSLLLVVSVGFVNQSKAQCSGAEAIITNFTVIPFTNSISYSFNWQYILGNASIEIALLCNGVQVSSLRCLPRLKDSTAGIHFVTGTAPITCSGVIRVEVRIWTNPACGGNSCIIFREVSQSTLPVSFKSFTAARNRSNVAVKWETSSEQNNSGFDIERNTNGIWEKVGFVASQATGGNSAADLSYQFIDLNNAKGVTQYRIKQIDLDAKSKFSEVRSVRGDGQKGQTIIYPNPSNDGKVNIVFEERNVSRDISLTDMSGRNIKQLKGVTSNNITIDNLTPGLYSLRIIIPGTGEQTVEKIVVNKR